MIIVRTSNFGGSTYYSICHGTVVHAIARTIDIVHFVVHVLCSRTIDDLRANTIPS